MASLNSYKYISSATTTTFAGSEIAKTVLGSINVNKILVGTVTIKAGATTIGIIAIGAPQGAYWFSDEGTQIESLSIVTSAADDLTVLYRNIY